MRMDVFPSDMLDKLSLMHELRRLMPRATEDQRAPGLLQTVTERLQSVQPRRVYSRHISQTQHDDWREPRHICSLLGKLLGSAEQERAMDSQDVHVNRHILILQNVRTSVFDVLFGNCRYR